MAEISHLLRVLDAYCDATGHTESTVSTRFLGAGHRVRQLREGSDMGSQRVVRVLESFSAAWPDNAVWPEDLPRPQPAERRA